MSKSTPDFAGARIHERRRVPTDVRGASVPIGEEGEAPEEGPNLEEGTQCRLPPGRIAAPGPGRTGALARTRRSQRCDAEGRCGLTPPCRRPLRPQTGRL